MRCRRAEHGMGPTIQLFNALALQRLLVILALTASNALANPGSSTNALAAEPPVIPWGLDAFRQWDRWPFQRIGMRAYMRSTYDRRGGNEGADASHFLYQLADDNNVTLDVADAGVLCFVRYNHWHGSPWRYVVDGTEHLVQESSTATPTHPVTNSIFLPADSFPPPLAVTWSATKGADLSWVPIPFEQSFRMGYSRTHYGTGYYIYDQFVPGTKLSHPIRAWDGQTPPDKDVLELIEKSGSDIAPANLTQLTNSVPVLKRNSSTVLFSLTHSPSLLRKLIFTISKDQTLTFGNAKLRITWDGRKEPSVDAPIGLFFGAGTLYNRDAREYLVKAFPVHIRFGATNVELACFFPMPFFKSAKLELINSTDETVSNVTCTVGCQPFAEWSRRLLTAPQSRQSFSLSPGERAGVRGSGNSNQPMRDLSSETSPPDAPSQLAYFHATYRDHPNPEIGKDLVLLDTRETEGGGDWSGSFIGTSLIFSDRANLNTLEGDPRFFFDDSQTPQAYGTGTEEWGGGGDYWGGQNMTLPFAGHPTGARNAATARDDQDKIESAYRFLLSDLMPFGKNAVIQLEHGGTDESTEHYQTVTYWYGAPAASLIKTDELKIGDPKSEAAHNYSSPQASASYSITSRYEWGVDTIKGREIYPAQTDSGRKTTGTSEFTLKLTPNNFGLLLRRKLDYAFPNQRAEVYVADADKSARGPEWKLAGIWYLAGANTCVYSNPKGELGAAQHIVETSNRRFRDDEFLVPLDLTQGRSAICVRIKFTPVTTPLFPGYPLPELAWSEIRYDAYCFVLPQWRP